MPKATQLQLVFDKTYDLKNQIKVIKNTYKSFFADSSTWQKLVQEQESLNARKKEVIAGIRSQMEGELEQLDNLEQELKDELMVLSDKALNDYIKGININITDKKGFVCEPVFTVKYKRTGEKKGD